MFIFIMLEIEFRALSLPGKCSTMELYPHLKKNPKKHLAAHMIVTPREIIIDLTNTDTRKSVPCEYISVFTHMHTLDAE
jgi:hypothetical protein